MRIILYHTGKCNHGHDTFEFSKRLYTELTNNSFNVFPVKPPTRRVLACSLLAISGKSQKGNLQEEFLRELDDYLVIVVDPIIQEPVSLEWSDSGEALNNAELFNDFLKRNSHDELPVISTGTNRVSMILNKPASPSGTGGGTAVDRPFTILRVNGTDVHSVVDTVELYREFVV